MGPGATGDLADVADVAHGCIETFSVQLKGSKIKENVRQSHGRPFNIIRDKGF
ncbi:MAG: hypothetical protein KKD44_07015 [Proteobacteria bacterium]|nr:hypothetical protein [Pseudomonadota bacterium]